MSSSLLKLGLSLQASLPNPREPLAVRGPDIGRRRFKMRAERWCSGLTKQLDLQVPVRFAIFSRRSNVFCPAR